MRLFWKIYFFLILLEAAGIPLYTIASIFVDEATFTTQIGIHFVLAIFGVIGLYGFVYGKPLITKVFWTIFTPIFIGWSISVTVGLIPLYSGFFETGNIEIRELLWLIPYLPQFYALVIYSYTNSNIEREVNAT